MKYRGPFLPFLLLLLSPYLENDVTRAAGGQNGEKGKGRSNSINLAPLFLYTKIYIKIFPISASGPARSAPVFLSRPSETTAMEGAPSVSLDCAANGSPPPAVTWLRDGVRVDTAHLDSRFSTVGAGSLNIRDVKAEDAGEFF